jgi:hypothetical protein
MSSPSMPTQKLDSSSERPLPLLCLEPTGQLSRRRVMTLLMAAGATPALLCFPSTRGRSQPSMNSFELTPGVVVDRDQNQAYLMTPQNGVAAVNLADGSEAWRSSEGTRPLVVAEDVILCQQETAAPDNNLLLVGLNRRDGGRPTFATRIALPAGVIATLGSSRISTFSVEARAQDGEVVVSWEHTRRPLQDKPPRIFSRRPGEAPPEPDVDQHARFGTAPGRADPGRTGPSVVEGAARVNLRSGTVSEQRPSGSRLSSGRVDRPAPDAVLSGLTGVQFLSADNRHVLNSERIADDSVWEKYRWSVYDRSTVQKIGEILEQFSSAPFFIVGSRIVYLTGPYSRRTDAGMLNEPLQIRAVELGTGSLAWRHPIRDPMHREPDPP